MAGISSYFLWYSTWFRVVVLFGKYHTRSSSYCSYYSRYLEAYLAVSSFIHPFSARRCSYLSFDFIFFPSLLFPFLFFLFLSLPHSFCYLFIFLLFWYLILSLFRLELSFVDWAVQLPWWTLSNRRIAFESSLTCPIALQYGPITTQ